MSLTVSNVANTIVLSDSKKKKHHCFVVQSLYVARPAIFFSLSQTLKTSGETEARDDAMIARLAQPNSCIWACKGFKPTTFSPNLHKQPRHLTRKRMMTLDGDSSPASTNRQKETIWFYRVFLNNYMVLLQRCAHTCTIKNTTQLSTACAQRNGRVLLVGLFLVRTSTHLNIALAIQTFSLLHSTKSGIDLVAHRSINYQIEKKKTPLRHA